MNITTANYTTVELSTASPGDLAIATGGTTGNMTITNNGDITGRVDVQGAASLNFSNTANTWYTSGVSNFTNGADTLSTTSTGEIDATNATINFLNGNDTFNNAGLTVAVGTNVFDFGAGTDSTTNTGTIQVEGTTTFANLENFYQTDSTIDMDAQNDDTGDITNISGAFTSSGDSALVVDSYLGGDHQLDCTTAAVSDCMNIGSSSTANVDGYGTAVYVYDTNEYGPGALNLGGIVVVNDATTYDTANDFYLDGPNVTGSGTPDAYIHKGLFDYHLVLNTTGANPDWALVGIPGQGAMEMTKFESLLQNVWYETAEGWSERTAELRDEYDNHAGRPEAASLDTSIGWSVWGKAFYGSTRRDTTESVTALGNTFTFDTTDRQELDGFQAGVDYTKRGDDNSIPAMGVLRRPRHFGYDVQCERRSCCVSSREWSGVI